MVTSKHSSQPSALCAVQHCTQATSIEIVQELQTVHLASEVLVFMFSPYRSHNYVAFYTLRGLLQGYGCRQAVKVEG